MIKFKLLQNFINDEFCEKYLLGEGWEIANVTNHNGSKNETNQKSRRSSVRFYSNDQIPLFDKIKKYSDAYFDVGEITFIDYQLTRYDDTNSGFFHMHDDKIRTKDKYIRKLSCSIFLSDPDSYRGGDFIFQKYDLKSVRNWNAKYNCIMFPSEGTFHAVLPVTKGTRYSLVCWAMGPNPEYDPEYRVWMNEATSLDEQYA